MSATVLAYAGQYEEALKVLNAKDAETLETLAMSVQCCVKLHRMDKAGEALKRLTSINDDATITQLTTAWVNLGRGGEKIEEAFYSFEELTQKYGSTPLLLNGQAAALIQQGKYEEAESVLTEAEEKDSNCANTMINLNIVTSFTGKTTDRAYLRFNERN